MVSRRGLLTQAVTTSILGLRLTSARSRASSTSLHASHDETDGVRFNRVQLVEADPEFGFNFSYWLAKPESYREGPVPLLFEMNNASIQDEYEDVKNGAEEQVSNFGYWQGAWLSEELGVPHLKPIVPAPEDTPIDWTHYTVMLDRETMLLDGTEFARLDRQLLRMTEHARRELLSDIETHDQLLFYGNSSEGAVAERMAAMHPDDVLAAACGGSSLVMLPLERLGPYTLNYPIGIADFDSVVGKPYDRGAHDAVDKFYFLGAEDETGRRRLPMDSTAFPTNVWNDRDLYDAARAVFGPDPHRDRFPRCHIAFQKAGVRAQFRIYEGMTHDPKPASHDILEFFRRSIAGEDISSFGQRLELPFDREIGIGVREPEVGESVPFTVGGEFPPPEGLVSYTWEFGDGETGTGIDVTHRYGDAGTYDVDLAMATVHGQQATKTMQLSIKGTVGIGSVSLTTAEVQVGDPVKVAVKVTNQATGPEKIQLVLKEDEYPNTRFETVEVTVDSGVTEELTLTHAFDQPGEYPLQLNGQSIGTVSVRKATPSPSPTPSPGPSPTPTRTPTNTEAETPGLGVLSALAGLGSAIGYAKYRRDREE